jgi:AraC-like DNA-binding protein
MESRMAPFFEIGNATFASSLIEPALRLHYYRKWIQGVCEVTPCEGTELHASVLVLRVDDVLAARSISSPAHYFRDSLSNVDRSLDDYVLVQFVVRGELSCSFDSNTSEMTKGDVFLCDLACRMDLWVDDVEHIHLLVPKGRLQDIKLEIHGRVVPRTSLHCRALCDRLLRIFDIDLPPSSDRMRESMREAVELLIWCINSEAQKRQSSETIEKTRQKVMDYINRNLTAGHLSPEFLRDHFAISRAKLYRLFADLGGIQRYIRDKRLDGAIREICRHPKRSISDTAKRYGFTNNRQFQRAIRSRFGITARDARTGWGIDSIFRET